MKHKVKNLIAAILISTILITTLVSAIPTVNLPITNSGTTHTTSNEIVNLYKPICLSCNSPTPTSTPAPVWTSVNVDFTVSPTIVRTGQPVTFTGSQISGAPLSESTIWQFMAQSNSDLQLLNGKIVSFIPKKVSSLYSIKLTVKDNSQMLNGYILKKGILKTI